MLERNEKGFTLIEIIVSTAIGIVVLGVVLSMILTAFDTFGTFSTTGLKKESLDNLVDYVRNEVMNATEVVMSDSTPNPTNSQDWHWLAVKDGQLYYGDNGSNTSGKLVVNSSYYKQKSSYDRYPQDSKMTWSGTCSQTNKNDDYTYIVNFSYKLSYQGTSYSKSDAINFSNVKHEEDSDIKNKGDIRLLSKKNTEKNLDDNNLKLWYRKATKSSSNTNDNDNDNNNDNIDSDASNPNLTHTVADKVYFMSSYHNRGYFVNPSESIWHDSFLTRPYAVEYHAGTTLYYKGYWWMLVVDLPANQAPYNEPGQGGRYWQRLSEDFSPTSVYFKGDVVKYNGSYYQRQISEFLNNDVNPPQPYNPDDYPNATYKNTSSTWKYIGTTVDDTIQGFDMNYPDAENGKISKIINYKAPQSSPLNDPARLNLKSYSYQGQAVTDTNAYQYATDFPTVNVYDSNKTYNIGDLVKVKIEGSDGGRGDQYAYYQLYKKISEPMSSSYKAPGSSYKSGWELLENEYSPSSSYEYGKEMRVGYTDIDEEIAGTSADYITMNKLNGNIQYNGETYNLGSLNTICNDNLVTYFVLKYDKYTTSKEYKNGQWQYTFDSNIYGNTGDWWLDRAMIYYNKKKAYISKRDEVMNEQNQCQDNGKARKELWKELTYNDIVQEG